jgi:hypothetical protein
MIANAVHSRTLSLLVKGFVLTLVGLSVVYCIWGWFYNYYLYASDVVVPYFLLELTGPILESLCVPLWIGLLVILIGRVAFKYRLFWIAAYSFFVVCGTLPVVIVDRYIPIDMAVYQHHIYRLGVVYDANHQEGPYFFYECDNNGYLCHSHDMHYYGPFSKTDRARFVINDTNDEIEVHLTLRGTTLEPAIYKVKASAIK